MGLGGCLSRSTPLKAESFGPKFGPASGAGTCVSSYRTSSDLRIRRLVYLHAGSWPSAASAASSLSSPSLLSTKSTSSPPLRMVLHMPLVLRVQSWECLKIFLRLQHAFFNKASERSAYTRHRVTSSATRGYQNESRSPCAISLDLFNHTHRTSQGRRSYLRLRGTPQLSHHARSVRPWNVWYSIYDADEGGLSRGPWSCSWYVLHIKSRLDSRAQPLLYDAEYRTPIMASYEDLAIH